MPAIRIPSMNVAVDCASDGTILDALIMEGVDVAFACQEGTCGTCRSRLVSGRVESLPFSELALSRKEQEQGYILICRSMPQTDCEIEPAA
ncbi:MAG: 2Fe-2S iron-sulfur cluster-binding protein [Burkholderiales bacterium]